MREEREGRERWGGKGGEREDGKGGERGEGREGERETFFLLHHSFTKI